MTPDPRPTKQECADELEAASHKATNIGDLLFAKELSRRAEELREQDIQEQKKNEKH